MNAWVAIALADVEQLITDGNLATALKLLNKLRVTQPTLQLSHLALHQLIQRLLKDRQYAEAIPFMREHTSRFDVQRESLQLNLAKLLLHLQRPRQALDVLRQSANPRIGQHSATNPSDPSPPRSAPDRRRDH